MEFIVMSNNGHKLIHEDSWEKIYKVTDLDKQRGLSGIKLLNGVFEDSIDNIIERLNELKVKYPEISFWVKKIIWKKPKWSKGYIQFTIRPYIQGYGCDGTTDSNVHLIAMTWAERHGLNYLELYKRAYGDRDHYDHKEIGKWFKEIGKLTNNPSETIIPNKIDTKLMLGDLRDINNYSLEDVLEECI